MAARRYRHIALVKFVGTFPMDLLRYDNCFPIDKENERIIKESLDLTTHRGERQVKVSRVTQTGKPPWTIARWESFGLGIENIKTEIL